MLSKTRVVEIKDKTIFIEIVNKKCNQNGDNQQNNTSISEIFFYLPENFLPHGYKIAKNIQKLKYLLTTIHSICLDGITCP